jgi:anti-sigma-K factor RskA
MVQEDHVIDDLPAFALGALDPGEWGRIEKHLKSCPRCNAELYAFSETIGQLALSVPQNAPSPLVKKRLLAQIDAQNNRLNLGQVFKRWFQSAPAFSMISITLVLVLVVSNIFLWREVSSLNQMQRHGYASVGLSGTKVSPDATGMVVYTQNGLSGFLVVNNLSPLPDNQQYQLWLIKGTNRVNGGIFSVSPDGYHVMEIESPELLTNYDGFGITIEPSGGSPGPTGSKVLGGSF